MWHHEWFLKYYAEWNKSNIDKCTVWSQLYVKSKTSELVETKSRIGSYQTLEGGGKGKMLVKGYKPPVRRWIISGYLMYCIVILDDNIVLHILKFLREIWHVIPQKISLLGDLTWCRCQLTLVVIVQHIIVSNQHILHLKPRQCYMSNISQSRTKKNTSYLHLYITCLIIFNKCFSF